MSDEIPPAGFLGNLSVGQSGSAALHIYSEKLKVSSVVGRSIVISSGDGTRCSFLVYPCFRRITPYSG